MTGAVGPDKPVGRRRVGRVVGGVVAGVVIVAVAVSAVLAGGSSRGGHGGGGGGSRTTRTLASNPHDHMRWRHIFDAEYVGPVWVTVDPSDSATRSVTIVWGPWQRRITQVGDAANTYVFSKGITAKGDTVPPTTVIVDPPAIVTFGAGRAPAGSTDINKDWEPAR